MFNNFSGKCSLFWGNFKKLIWGRVWPLFRERVLLRQKINIIFFYHKLGNGCFIIKLVFRKSRIFGQNCDVRVRTMELCMPWLALRPVLVGHGDCSSCGLLCGLFQPAAAIAPLVACFAACFSNLRRLLLPRVRSIYIYLSTFILLSQSGYIENSSAKIHFVTRGRVVNFPLNTVSVPRRRHTLPVPCYPLRVFNHPEGSLSSRAASFIFFKFILYFDRGHFSRNHRTITACAVRQFLPLLSVVAFPLLLCSGTGRVHTLCGSEAKRFRSASTLLLPPY